MKSFELEINNLRVQILAEKIKLLKHGSHLALTNEN